MLITEVYNRVYSFVEFVVTPYIFVTVVFADQIEAPVPSKPFITIAIDEFQEISMPMHYEIDYNGVRNVVSNMMFKVTFNCYSSVLHQAEEILNLLQRKFRSEIAYSYFKADMAYMRTIMGVSSLPVAIGGINESRAIFEAEFALTQNFLEDVGLIEHIEINDEITGNKLVINK